jgi:hypothetical protein
MGRQSGRQAGRQRGDESAAGAMEMDGEVAVLYLAISRSPPA